MVASTYVVAMLCKLSKEELDSVVLDMTPPNAFISKNDHHLWDLYRKDYLKLMSAIYTKQLVEGLWEKRQVLKGLTLYSKETIPSKLTPTWFKRIAAPKNMAEALELKSVSLSPEFIQNVLGDMSVWKLISEKLELKVASTPVSKAEAVVTYLKAA